MQRASALRRTETAIGAHFPEVADIAAAPVAARFAVRFKSLLPADFKPGREPATVRARGRVPRGGNNRSKAGITIENATFTSPDEVCRPRVGYDANVNRDVTLR